MILLQVKHGFNYDSFLYEDDEITTTLSSASFPF